MEKKARILAVDDDDTILELFKGALELEGYAVDIASSGGSALALFEARRPDLVILDIKMPEMDGYQLLGLIRQRSDVPVIMVTGERDPTSLNKALDIGADDYVTKPFRIRELEARIRAKLRRKALEDRG